ncbi:MAG: hypothetical protein H0V01_15790 [Bacteroidetes bacterium]|nr:hypothetical protein [Bacteroidota bacterium]HET6244238.1 hypothetical protein [Bacteroidia bacterium]
MKILLSILIFYSTHLTAQIRIDFESGIVFTGYNHVRIPGNTGTFISLNSALSQNLSGFYRARTSLTFFEKHSVSILAAPLQLEYNGIVPYDLKFEDTEFFAGENLNVLYRFDSYRLTYRYNFIRKERFFAGAGITAKVRDASIAFSSDDKKAVSSDLGVVPLINFYGAWMPVENISLTIDGDALASPQGRALDVAFFYNQKIYKHVWIKAGYRFLEGGADNKSVYTFSFFHYAAFGLWISY